MEDQQVKVAVVREHREDRAERTFEIRNAPTFTYQARKSYRDRKMVDRVWRPDYLRLEWARGVLRRAFVQGNRIKKDGTTGMILERTSFPIKDGVVLPAIYGNGTYEAPAWLSAAVEVYGEVPAFRDND